MPADVPADHETRRPDRPVAGRQTVPAADGRAVPRWRTGASILRRTGSAGVIVAPAVACLLACLPSASAAPGLDASEKLVPAVYRHLEDDKGGVWQFRQNGELGNSNTSPLANGLVLNINQNRFYNYQPLMTADGLEYVLDNNQQNIGLQAVRRVRLNRKDGVVRYLEILNNPGPTDVTAVLDLNSNFGNGKFDAFVTERGTKNPTLLGRKESGVLVVPKNRAMRAMLFTLASPKSDVKPTITSQGDYQLNFQYQVTVPAGQTIVLMHTVSQPEVPDDLEPRTLARIFREASLSRQMSRTVRESDRALVANFSSGTGFGGASLLGGMTVDGLGVERARTDVLAMGDKTRLLGRATCGRLTLSGEFGSAEIPFEEIAAIVGGGRSEFGGGARLFLRDGQVLSGLVDAEALRFVLPSGAAIDLSMDRLDRLVRSASEEEGRWGEGVGALLETYQGERIALERGGDVPMTCATPWGPLSFTLDEILWLSPPEDEPVGHHIAFKDGSRFYAYLSGATASLPTRHFGLQAFLPRQIRSIVTTAALARKDETVGSPPDASDGDAGGLSQPHLVLSGGQRMIGQLDAPVLGVVTNAELIELPPETIRRMRNTSEEGEDTAGQPAVFEIELWGGSLVTGHLRETVVPVRIRSDLWTIPVEDIVEVVSPLPRISDASRQKIGELIRNLGSDDWRAREAATEELADYGYMAAPLLEEALKVTPDAEVRRRLELLLEESR